MEKVIERLKKEKMESEKRYYQTGKDSGVEWVKTAGYEEIQWALKHEIVREMKRTQRGLIGCDPTQDEILGDYFAEVIRDDPFLGFVETARGHYMPNDLFVAWEEGWHGGVKEFWQEIEDKI